MGTYLHAIICLIERAKHYSHLEFARLIEQAQANMDDAEFVERCCKEAQLAYEMSLKHLRGALDERRSRGYLEEARLLEIEAGVGDIASCAIAELDKAGELARNDTIPAPAMAT